MKKTSVIFLLLFFILSCSDTNLANDIETENQDSTDVEKELKLDRIGVRKGSPYAEFYNTKTGEKFTPIGSSFVRLYEVENKGPFHSLFAEGEYDKEKAETALKMMAESGYNIVRVWIYHGHIYLNPHINSIAGQTSRNNPELYTPYVNNVLNFLELATKYNIYVQLAIDRTPMNKYYMDMYMNNANTYFPDVTGAMNREYMTPKSIEAKELYIDKIMEAIKKYNPNLFSTIFAYEIRNEIHSESHEAPFNRNSGSVETAAGTYDMGDAASRQACQDDNVTLFLNRTVSRIKQHDPEALTTSSVFTFDAVKKNGKAGNGLLPWAKDQHQGDGRWPIRPTVLMASALDFIDIHNYYPNDWQTGLNSSEWQELDKTKKPFIAGEFGAHRVAFSTVNEAAEALYQYRNNILRSGFQGALLFTWDTTEHTRWTMTEDGAVIREKLKPSNID